MDSALSPREIQARIRGGESLEAVAEAAGVPAEHIEPFAAPVIAEREHVLGQALGCPVRRRGESSSVRALRHVAAEGLQQGGVPDDEVVWDAWRDPERHWIVVARFSQDNEDHEARFGFDLRGRFSVAKDDLARALIGEPAPAALAPYSLTSDPDNEPTIGLDERHSSSPGTGRASADFPARPVPRQPIEQVVSDEEPDLSVEAAQDDLVGHSSQLDVLYDMLSSFDEDSVNVYADLSRPVIDDDPDDDLLNQAFDEEADTDVAPDPDPSHAGPTGEDGEDGVNGEEDDPAAEERSAAAPAEVPVATPAEPEQDALVEVTEAPAAKPKPKPRKGRASIPTWDEIVFGGPKP